MKQSEILKSASDIQDAQPTPGLRRTKRSCGNGLWVYITPKGSKSFYQLYSFKGKPDSLCLGAFTPEMNGVDLTFDEAIRESASVRIDVNSGIDPKISRKRKKNSDAEGIPTVEELAKSIHDNYLKNGIWLEETAHKNWQKITNHIIGQIGVIPVSNLTEADVVNVLKRLVKRGTLYMAKRIRQLLALILDTAASSGYISDNVKSSMYRKGVLPKAQEAEGFAALTEKDDVAELFYDSHHYGGEFLTVQLLKLSALVFARPSEIRCLKWSQVNFRDSIMTITVIKGGRKRNHRIHMATQVVEILKEVYRETGDKEQVFYSRRSKFGVMSSNTLNGALRSMGYGGLMTAHGYRAMAATIISTELKYREEMIDVQLSHLQKNQTKKAYFRGVFEEERKQMMQEWADFLYNSYDELQKANLDEIWSHSIR